MNDSIKIDRQTLKALGADARVSILKKLLQRRKTQAELASELSLKPPTVMEHLKALEASGLVARKEDSRKWKYYELTSKGRAVVSPDELKAWFVLGTTLLLAVAVAVFILPGWLTQTPLPASDIETQKTATPLVDQRQAAAQAFPEMAAGSSAAGASAPGSVDQLTQSASPDTNTTNRTNNTNSTLNSTPS